MVQALPVHSEDLSFLTPKVEPANDFFARVANTQATQQSTYASANQQVTQGTENAGRMLTGAAQEARNSLEFLQHTADWTRQFELKNILFPLEVRAQEAQLHATAAQADRQAWQFDQDKEKAVRDAQAREGYANNVLPQATNPNAPLLLDPTKPGQVVGAVDAMHEGARVRADNMDKVVQADIINTGIIAKNNGLMDPADWNKFKTDPDFQRDVLQKTRLHMQTKALEDQANKVGVDLTNAPVAKNADGTDATWKDVLANPEFRDASGKLRPEIEGAASKYIVGQTRQYQESQVRAKYGAQKDIEELRLKNKMDIAKMDDATKRDVEMRKAEIKESLGNARDSFNRWKVTTTGQQAKELKELEVKARKTGLSDAEMQRYRVRVYGMALDSLKGPGGMPPDAAKRAEEIAKGFEADLGLTPQELPPTTPGSPGSRSNPVAPPLNFLTPGN